MPSDPLEPPHPTWRWVDSGSRASLPYLLQNRQRLRRVEVSAVFTIGLLALFVADAVALEVGDCLLARGRHVN